MTLKERIRIEGLAKPLQRRIVVAIDLTNYFLVEFMHAVQVGSPSEIDAFSHHRSVCCTELMNPGRVIARHHRVEADTKSYRGVDGS